MANKDNIIVIGAGPVGALAALYAAKRGHNVNIYELRNGKSAKLRSSILDNKSGIVVIFYLEWSTVTQIPSSNTKRFYISALLLKRIMYFIDLVVVCSHFRSLDL